MEIMANCSEIVTDFGTCMMDIDSTLIPTLERDQFMVRGKRIDERGDKGGIGELVRE